MTTCNNLNLKLCWPHPNAWHYLQWHRVCLCLPSQTVINFQDSLALCCLDMTDTMCLSTHQSFTILLAQCTSWPSCAVQVQYCAASQPTCVVWYNVASADPCSWVQYSLDWPMPYRYNHFFGWHWVACVVWAQFTERCASLGWKPISQLADIDQAKDIWVVLWVICAALLHLLYLIDTISIEVYSIPISLTQFPWKQLLFLLAKHGLILTGYPLILMPGEVRRSNKTKAIGDLISTEQVALVTVLRLNRQTDYKIALKRVAKTNVDGM